MADHVEPNYSQVAPNDNHLLEPDHELGLDTPRGSTYLQPPRASFLSADDQSPRLTPQNSSLLQNATPHDSSALLASASPSPVPKDEVDHVESNAGTTPRDDHHGLPKRLRRLILFGSLALVLLVLVIVLPVALTVSKKHNNKNNSASSATSGTSTQSSSSPKSTASSRISGGDGSEITASDGSKFTYKNSFGGFWVSDPNNPFNNDARPNSWTPPLNTSWDWSKDRIFGVNLGGHLVLEPFISPPLYQKYPGAVDEWTLSTLMAADTANGGLNQLETHYDTFITEQDIAEIAGAGLNWIRIPIPFWAIDVWPGEPFLPRTSWKYLLRLLTWARKYGLRVNLDLHTCPGSQNGFNHSGKFGQVDFLNGAMGVANAQRMLNYIRIFVEFFSQPEYEGLVAMFGIVNEADLGTIGMDVITAFYQEAHDLIRSITGKGANKGPFISIHDGFHVEGWTGFLAGSDRIALDTHPYFAFSGQANNDPINTGTGVNAGGVWPGMACGWASGIVTNQQGFGVTIAGEFSNGFNDCGLFLLGVNQVGQTADCAKWQDASTWDDATKAGIMNYALASMDALQNWFFWTWKVGPASNGVVSSPLWSYQLGLENGWIPKDPRVASGFCSSIGQPYASFAGPFQPYQTGGAGAGSITAQNPWPPASISPGLLLANLPTYTSTAPVQTLPPPTFTPAPSPKPTLDGWFDEADSGLAPTTIAGCAYPDAWNAVTVAARSCGGAVAAVPAATTRATTTARGGGVVPVPAAAATTTAAAAVPDDTT